MSFGTACSSSSTLINDKMFLCSTELFNDDRFVEKVTLSHLVMKVLFVCSLEMCCELAVKLVDFGQHRAR